jgi:hypothetical protein
MFPPARAKRSETKPDARGKISLTTRGASSARTQTATHAALLFDYQS